MVLASNSLLSKLECNVNQLTRLDVRNGNNQNLAIFNSENNPNLKCIYVDDKDAPFLSNWFIDPASTFVETEAECDALMINNLEKEDDISIYPNPTEGIINIDFTENNFLKITITDIIGREIFEKFNVSQNQEVDLSYYKSGIYILSVFKDQEVFTTKIIKR